MKRAVLPIAFLLVITTACGDDDDAPVDTPTPIASAASPTSTPDPSTSPEPTPSPKPSTPGIKMERGDNTFLGNLAVLVETGCYNCDGPPSGIFRAYGYQGSGARYGWLLRTSEQAPGRKIVTDFFGNTLVEGTINDIVSTPDASVLAVSVCVQGTCALQGLDAFDADSITVTFRSLDGGITWSEIDRRGPVAHAVGALADGGVLVSNALDGAGTQREYVLLPDATPLKPPVEGAIPAVASDAILWVGAGGVLYQEDGTEFLRLPSSYRDGYPIDVRGTVTGANPSAIVRWYGTTVTHLGSIDFSNNSVDRVLSTEQLIRLGSWLPDLDAAVISSADEGQPFPAILNLETGEYSLILNPFDGGPGVDADTGRTYVIAAAQGPFIEVSGTGSCLNLRTEPSLSAHVITCLADGILLRNLGATQFGDGIEWLQVTTPAGTQGWSATTYLEY